MTGQRNNVQCSMFATTVITFHPNNAHSRVLHTSPIVWLQIHAMGCTGPTQEIVHGDPLRRVREGASQGLGALYGEVPTEDWSTH